MPWKKTLGKGSLCLLQVLAAGCSGAAARATADIPAFQGVETEHWLVQESQPVEQKDLLRAFAESARGYGCRTEKLGLQATQNIYGERRSYHGVTASCFEGTISLITLADGRVRIGCAKPTTFQACDRLLRNIAQAW
ncbi:MAG TPA: hypothetical protein VHO25_02050 [Polyangiaceae bacterium]|nr:hypothetical protein [Polyangiaceae bacterium]